MTNLFVSGLAWHSNEESLTHAFSPFGIIVEATVIRDRDTGRSRGFGFVRFATTEQAQNAIQALDRTMLDERIIGVNFAEGRGAGRGRGTATRRGGRAEFGSNSAIRGGGDLRQHTQPVEASNNTRSEGTNPYGRPVAPRQGQAMAVPDPSPVGANNDTNHDETSQDGNAPSQQFYYPPQDPGRRG